MSEPIQSSQSGGRIVSIDALRGLTILVMIFVNDLAGVTGTPAWMQHAHSGSDSMTFVDVVFPAFLFIVGMSIPFAIGRRLDRGERLWSIGRHVLTRTLGLLIIGVFMVNTESMEDGSLANNLWIFFMYLAVMLVWNELPREAGPKRRIAVGVRMAGIALLVILAFLYRNPEASGWIQLRTSWWGILGLIGWAYLVACTVYIIFWKNLTALLGCAAILYCIFLADQVGFFTWIPILPDYVGIGSMWGSQAAITLSGVILGAILTPGSPAQSHGGRMRWAFLYGLGLFITGVLLHSLRDVNEMFIIDKNAATPPWCLICSAITAWVWTAIYWLMDVRGWTCWAVIIAPAGQNPLFAYILAPILYAAYSLVGLSGLYFDTLGGQFAVGFWRSLAFTFFVTWLTGFLYKKGLRLRL